MAGMQLGLTGKNTDGSPCCCGSPQQNCGVTVGGIFVPLSGTDWCSEPPQAVKVTITGGSINYSGTIPKTQYGPAPNYAFSLTLDGRTIPDGTYTVHIYEFGTNACTGLGSSPQATGRFDVTQTITVKCGNPPVVVTLPAQFNTATFATGFALGGCFGQVGTIGFGGTTCYGDTPTLSIGLAVSGLSVCRTATAPDGNVSLGLRITSYPASITATGSASSCFDGVQSQSWSSCSVGTSSSQPAVVYKKYPIAVYGCNGVTVGQEVSGATVTLSGQYNGTGVTNGGTGCGLAFLTLDSFNSAATDTTWTITKDRFQTVTYSKSARDAALAAGGTYAGSLCPAGGSISPAPGFYCAGCAGLPLPATLHATCLGESVTLTRSGGAWTGNFSHTVESLICNDLQGRHSSGSVQFTLTFTGVVYNGNPAYPQVATAYRFGTNNLPNQCQGAATVPALQNGTNLVQFGNTTFSYQCGGAFMMSLTGGTWSYAFQANATQPAVTINIGASLVITE